MLDQKELELVQERIKPYLLDPSTLEEATDRLAQAVLQARRDRSLALFEPPLPKNAVFEEIETVRASTKSLRRALHGLSAETTARIIRSPKPFRLEDLDALKTYVRLLLKALDSARASLNAERRPRGRPRDEPARELALCTGEIWEELVGRKPSKGHAATLGPFGRLLEVVCDLASLDANVSHLQAFVYDALREDGAT